MPNDNLPTTLRSGDVPPGQSEGESIRTLIGEALGEASMCWSETPCGVFDSDRAIKIHDRVYQLIVGRMDQYIAAHVAPIRAQLNQAATLAALLKVDLDTAVGLLRYGYNNCCNCTGKRWRDNTRAYLATLSDKGDGNE